MGDIEEVCDRTIIINHGRVELDLPTKTLKRDYLHRKIIKIIPKNNSSKAIKIQGIEPKITKSGTLIFEVDTAKISVTDFLPKVLKEVEAEDITIENTPLEDIIHDLYLRNENQNEHPAVS